MAQLTASQRTSANLRAELARRRLSNRKVAADLGWPESNLGRLLRGDQPLRIDDLTALADYLGVPITVLLDEAGAA